ncbi:MAG: sugar kinase [Deltaproteobacteria bacterium]|jgi:ribokinase|nr:sugar kinase [Deltaproteobacteria bacterium]
MERNQKVVLGLGQCSFDLLGSLACYPQLDQKVELNSLLLQGGGPVATALVTLARLGVQTKILSRIGDDHFAHLIRSGLEREGVDCLHLSFDRRQTSQLAFIAIDQSGHRNVFWHRGTARALQADQLPLDVIGSAAVLHLDGLHITPSVVAAQAARQNGVVTVLDGGTLRTDTEKLLPLIDHMVVSQTFARQVAGHDLFKALDKLSAWNAEAVTITLGREGSLTRLQDGTCFRQPAFRVEAVDTTGCGDVFHGGYIYGLLQQWPMCDVVRFAAACAALKTRAVGGRTAIPTLQDVERLLHSQHGGQQGHE